MSLDYCPTCGEYPIWSNHTCPPSFFVFFDPDSIYWDIKTGSLSKKYFARDEEDAAIKFCNNDFEAPDELDVWVINAEEWYNVAEECDLEKEDEFDEFVKSKFKKFQMSSEVHRDFYASEIK